MRKILACLIIIILSVTFITGSTYAVFSDTSTVSGSHFSPGTPDLKLERMGSTSARMNAVPLKPGDSQAVSYKLTNTGTGEGNLLTVDLNHLLDSGGVNPEPELTPHQGDLSSNMDVLLWIDDGSGGGIKGDGVLNGREGTLYSGRLDQIASPYVIAKGFSAGVSTYVGISWSIPDDIGNEIQGDSCDFDMEFMLTQ